MKTFQLAPGLIISSGGEVLEYTDCTDDQIYFQNPETGRRQIFDRIDFWKEIERGLVIVLDSVVSSKLVIVSDQKKNEVPLLSDLDVKYVEDVETKLLYIHFMRNEGISRGQRRAIENALRKILIKHPGLSKIPGASTVQAWWKNYDTSLDGNQSLISHNAFRSRKSKLDADSELFLEDEIEQNYAQITRPSMSSVFGKYLRNLKEFNVIRLKNGRAPLQGVAERTFVNRIKKLPQKELTVARYGWEYARKHFKISQGPLPAEYPLDVVEIDHTLMNLYVIDDLSFLPLGRPTITAIKDRNSGILLGIYISFSGSGLASIAGAIKHSLTAHRQAFVIWEDLEHPWPAYGLGHIYSSDRGPDYFSPRYRAMILDLRANYEYCEVRTPWLKGSIERFFLMLEQTFFETLPGKTFRSLAERKDYDPAKHAVIRFSTLVYLLHKWAVDFHNVRPHSRKMATPLELWQEGIGIAPPPMPASPQKLNIILGDRHQGTIRNEGIQYLGLHYSDQTLQQLADEVGNGVKVDFIINPDNMGSIHLKHPHTAEYLSIHSTRPDYANGLTLFQHRYIRQEARLYSEKHHSIDGLLDTRHHIETLVQEEVFAKETRRKKDLARLAAINSNAVLDGEQRSIKSPFANADSASPKLPEKNVLFPEQRFTSIPHYGWGG